MQRFKLMTYFDVVGNAKDGWVVGNEAEMKAQVLLPKNFTEEDVVNTFVNLRYYADMLQIAEMTENKIEVVAKENGEPLFRLERIR